MAFNIWSWLIFCVSCICVLCTLPSPNVCISYVVFFLKDGHICLCEMEFTLKETFLSQLLPRAHSAAVWLFACEKSVEHFSPHTKWWDSAAAVQPFLPEDFGRVNNVFRMHSCTNHIDKLQQCVIKDNTLWPPLPLTTDFPWALMPLLLCFSYIKTCILSRYWSNINQTSWYECALETVQQCSGVGL